MDCTEKISSITYFASLPYVKTYISNSLTGTRMFSC